MKKDVNYLKAVFWDYPEFTDEERLVRSIPSREENVELRRWFMYRFLEHGRAIDALKFFSMEEIKNELPHLKMRPYFKEKWSWITENYAYSNREY